eukprot:324981-Chlamydomonas_euryale.AAC.1
MVAHNWGPLLHGCTHVRPTRWLSNLDLHRDPATRRPSLLERLGRFCSLPRRAGHLCSNASANFVACPGAPADFAACPGAPSIKGVAGSQPAGKGALRRNQVIAISWVALTAPYTTVVTLAYSCSQSSTCCPHGPYFRPYFRPYIRHTRLPQVEFGANQVILTRTTECLNRLPDVIRNSNAMRLSVPQAKGLEFNDVFLVGACGDSQMCPNTPSLSHKP